MRNLGNVIEDMKKEIPNDEQSLWESLDSVQTRIMYTAPECQEGYWKETTKILFSHFSFVFGPQIPDEGTWQYRVLLIYNPELPNQDNAHKKDAK